MSGVMRSSTALMAAAEELDTLSKALLEVEWKLGPLETELVQFEEDFKAGLWQAHIDNGEKHPPEETRTALAHKAWDPAKYGELLRLRKARARAKSRLSDLREIVAAHRSIVSAAKTELEASEGPQPQWSRVE